MTDLAAWIASKRAASEGATEGPWGVWCEEGDRNGTYRHSFCRNDQGPGADGELTSHPDWMNETNHRCLGETFGKSAEEAHANARHIAAFDPATTRRLLDCVEALDMLRRESKAYGGTSPAAEAAADAALDALGGGGE